MLTEICGSFIGILIIIIGVIFNEVLMRWANSLLDRMLERLASIKFPLKLPKIPTSVFYLIWALGLCCVVILYSTFQRNSILNPTSELDGGTSWAVSIYDGTGDLLDIGPKSRWNGTVRGNQNGLQYDMGFDPPQFFHSDKFLLQFMFDQNLPFDQFSMEFSTVEEFTESRYCFSLEFVDDGANVLIDGAPIIERWWGYQVNGLYREPIFLDSGSHKIVLQYFDNNARAGFQLQWYPKPGKECVSSGDPGYQQKNYP